jgi:hypothetical protein
MKTNKITNSLNLTRKRLEKQSKSNKPSTINTSLCLASNKIYNSYSKQSKQSKQQNVIQEYNKHLDTIINNLCTQNKSLFTHIYNIKESTNIHLTFNIFHDLDNTNYIIPSYINIFKDLVSNDYTTFTDKFTQEELNEVKTLLNSDKKKKEKNHGGIYKYLDTHKIGNKIGDIFYTQLNTNTLPESILSKYPSLQFHKLLINDFTSFNVIQNIEKHMNTLVIYSFTYNNTEYKDRLYIYLDKNKTNIGSNYLQILGRNIIQRILFYNSLLNTQKIPERFIIFLTDLEKEIDKQLIENHHFKTNNVNSAVTNKQDIIIYRKQEILKSIFHELTHFHSLDFMNIPSNIVNDLINTHHIKQENTYLLYESVTETLANILNNIYLSSDIKIFKDNLKNEIKYSTLQVAKILKVLKYKKWSDFTNTNSHGTNSHITNTKFTQDSCMFSYYILKTYILINLDTYFKNCLDSNLHFITTENGFSNLMKIFTASRYNVMFDKVINLFISKLPNYKSSDGKDNYKKLKNIYKTLRMTCLDPTFI